MSKLDEQEEMDEFEAEEEQDAEDDNETEAEADAPAEAGPAVNHEESPEERTVASRQKQREEMEAHCNDPDAPVPYRITPADLPVMAPRSGIVQQIDAAQLARLCGRHGVVCFFPMAESTYVLSGTPLFYVCGAEKMPPDFESAAMLSIDIGYAGATPKIREEDTAPNTPKKNREENATPKTPETREENPAEKIREENPARKTPEEKPPVWRSLLASPNLPASIPYRGTLELPPQAVAVYELNLSPVSAVPAAG